MNPDREESVRLEALYQRLSRTLRYAYGSVSDDDIADAIQHAMNRYCTHAPQRVKASQRVLFCWLHTVSRRRLLLELARRKRFHGGGGASHNDLDSIASADDTSLLASTSAAERMLLALTPRSAYAVWLHDVECWKPSEIAEQLGCSANAVNHRVKRGREILRRMLRDDVGLFGA